jgi:hypothetical protein
MSNDKKIRNRKYSEGKCQLCKLKTHIKKTTPYVFQRNSAFQRSYTKHIRVGPIKKMGGGIGNKGARKSRTQQNKSKALQESRGG